MVSASVAAPGAIRCSLASKAKAALQSQNSCLPLEVAVRRNDAPEVSNWPQIVAGATVTPTPHALTESALRKSQALLAQLSDLNLDNHDDDCTSSGSHGEESHSLQAAVVSPESCSDQLSDGLFSPKSLNIFRKMNEMCDRLDDFNLSEQQMIATAACSKDDGFTSELQSSSTPSVLPSHPLSRSSTSTGELDDLDCISSISSEQCPSSRADDASSVACVGPCKEWSDAGRQDHDHSQMSTVEQTNLRSKPSNAATQSLVEDDAHHLLNDWGARIAGKEDCLRQLWKDLRSLQQLEKHTPH